MSLHGGDIYKIYRENRKKVIDYSANINPLGFPKKLKKNIMENIDNLIHYPDPNYIELKESISRKIGVSVESICVGNGATELIFLWMKALKPKKTLIVLVACVTGFILSIFIVFLLQMFRSPKNES